MDNIEILNILEYLPLEYVMKLALFRPSIKNYLHNLFSVQYPSHEEFVNSIKTRSSSIIDLYLKYSKNINIHKLFSGLITVCKRGREPAREIARYFFDRDTQCIGYETWIMHGHFSKTEDDDEVKYVAYNNREQNRRIYYSSSTSFARGYKNIAEYILDRNLTNINNCFENACLNDYIDYVKFLFKLGATNLEEGLFWALYCNCDNVVSFLTDRIDINNIEMRLNKSIFSQLFK